MKLWYESKLVWLNVVLTLIGTLTLVADYLDKQPVLTVSGILMVIVGVLGVILRIWFTDQPIKSRTRK